MQVLQVLTTLSRGTHSTLVHRGRQIQQKIKVLVAALTRQQPFSCTLPLNLHINLRR